MRALEIITGHVIYNPAYTFKFQLKTTLDWTPTELNVKKAKLPKKQKDHDPDDPMLVHTDDTEFERLEKKFFPLVRQVENLYKSQPRLDNIKDLNFSF